MFISLTKQDIFTFDELIKFYFYVEVLLSNLYMFKD